MTINFALEYIPRRMRELGYGDNYILRLRQFILIPKSVITVQAHAEYFILVEAQEGIRIESNTGVYSSFEEQSDELQYEHNGEIIIDNAAEAYQWVKFIQVIPLQKEPSCTNQQNCN